MFPEGVDVLTTLFVVSECGTLVKKVELESVLCPDRPDSTVFEKDGCDGLVFSVSSVFVLE